VEGVNIGKGVYTKSGCNAEFVRCILNGLIAVYNSCAINGNLNVINCLINSECYLYFSSTSSVNIVNSVLYSITGLENCNIVNSYLCIEDNYCNNYNNSKNCIISYQHGCNTTYSVSSSNVFSNCVAINMPKFFNNHNGGIGSNTHRSAMSDVFETFTGGTLNYYEEYILKEDFATSFLGSDGTEVGIHGGWMPYSLDPSYMIVKSCNVASKSTIDGKLSVDIEIETEE